MFRNVILQALGAQTELTPRNRSHSDCQVTSLLCSDGLSGKLRNEGFVRSWPSRKDLAAACSALVAKQTIVAEKTTSP